MFLFRLNHPKKKKDGFAWKRIKCMCQSPISKCIIGPDDSPWEYEVDVPECLCTDFPSFIYTDE